VRGGGLRADGEQFGRERIEHDRKQPAEVKQPQPRVGPPDEPEHLVVVAPRRRDNDEADQEREVVAVVVPDREPEPRHGAPLWHRQVDREQRHRDGDHGVGEEGQPFGGTRVGLNIVIGHSPIIPGAWWVSATQEAGGAEGMHQCRSG